MLLGKLISLCRVPFHSLSSSPSVFFSVRFEQLFNKKNKTYTCTAMYCLYVIAFMLLIDSLWHKSTKAVKKKMQNNDANNSLFKNNFKGKLNVKLIN